MNKPVIGISVSLDTSRDDSLIPGTFLYYVNAEIVQAIEQFGGLPVLIPETAQHALDQTLHRLDGVVITGGLRPLPKHLAAQSPLPSLKEQNPARYEYDYSLIYSALAQHLPLLGICRGMQMLNEVTGGTLQRQVDSPERHRTPAGADEIRHLINVVQDSHFGNILGVEMAEVNSYHVQAVQSTGPSMRVSARSPDGTVEAIESIFEPFVSGVQYHPERMLSFNHSARLFSAFIEAALERVVY